jgi:uncharacterized protein YmfQ (DUF2313 family)
MSHIYIINSRGEKEIFSESKLYNSVKRVAISNDLAKEIFNSVKNEIYPGITTLEIFSKIKKLLHKSSKPGAMRFNLKDGMRKLGPTGFLFEKFIAEIFENLGYQVKIDQYLPGHCVKNYEIDLVAQKDDLVYVGECKYRNLAGEMVHQTDALANYARFQDILSGSYFKQEKYNNCKIKTILITNTKFTNNAYDYSSCMGIDLLGWNTPKDEGLQNIIDRHQLYPITLLSSLKGYLKDIMVSEEIMLVSDVLKINPEDFAKKFKLPVSSVLSLVKEAKAVLAST